MKEYTVYEMSKPEWRRVSSYRFRNLFFYFPMAAAIPVFIECGMVAKYWAHNEASMMTVLQFCDAYFLMWGLLMYNMVNKTVTSIVYNVDANTFTVKQLSTWLLREREFTFKPEELTKHYKKSMNPFIGYRSRRKEDGDLRFATESNHKSCFVDRQFLDSMIFRIKDQPANDEPDEP